MADRDLRGIVNRIVDLPTLPQVVGKILGLLDDPSSSVKDINAVMSRDPALVARILKVVNSAFYGLPNRVSSISQAIVILGFNTVKSLAISASVLDMFGTGEDHFNYEEFWTHSVGCGTVASAIARKQGGADPDTAFVVGLMHDVGKLVIDQFAPVEFQDILQHAREQEVSFHEAESACLETSHAEIGYWLVQRWQLADDLCEAIHHHHTIPEAPDPPSQKMAAICAFADYICHAKHYGASGCYGKPMLPVAAWECLDIEKDELPGLLEAVNEDLHRADEFLSLLHT